MQWRLHYFHSPSIGPSRRSVRLRLPTERFPAVSRNDYSRGDPVRLKEPADPLLSFLVGVTGAGLIIPLIFIGVTIR